MASDFKLKGMKQVMRNLDKAIQDIENRSLKGLILAAIYLRRDMEKTSPTIPVDFGNLRSSWFVVTSKGETKTTSPIFKEDDGTISSSYEQAKQTATQLAKQSGKPTVIIGFGANYAVFVHESVDYNFKRPGSGAKFFEEALRRNEEQILKIIQENCLIN